MEGATMTIQSHEHPALTVDVILFALNEDDLSVLLVRRRRSPFEGAWAFPGGFVDVGEAPRDAARRELGEETGIRGVHLEQLRAYGEPERDPRGHVVTVAYLGVVGHTTHLQAEAGSDAGQVRWWRTSNPPSLAFDHSKILNDALFRLSSALTCTPADTAMRRILPQDLSLGDLEVVCRTITRILGNGPGDTDAARQRQR
jgi:8-oxo-dGTP diphosphatase